MKTLDVSFVYSSTELGFKGGMPAHTNACIICVLVGKINRLYLVIMLSEIHFMNLFRTFLPCHVILIITHTSVILAKAFSKQKINHSIGGQSLNSKQDNSFISVNAFVTVSCKR